MATLVSIMTSPTTTKTLHDIISKDSVNTSTSKGDLEETERLEVFVLEALAKNRGALEASWGGGLVRRVECLARLLSISTCKTLCKASSSVKGDEKVTSHLKSSSRPQINRAIARSRSSTNSTLNQLL